VWACNHHVKLYNTSAQCRPSTLQEELSVFKIQEKIMKMDQKNFIPPLVLGGPWEGLGPETFLPSIHTLAQSMASRHHLMKKKKKNYI
jgi:hypothetical protein